MSSLGSSFGQWSVGKYDNKGGLIMLVFSILSVLESSWRLGGSLSHPSSLGVGLLSDESQSIARREHCN